MTRRTKAAQKSARRIASARPHGGAGPSRARREAGKTAPAVKAATPRRAKPGRRKPSPSPAAAGGQSTAAPKKAAVRPEATTASAPGLPPALAALIENRRALVRASADLGARLAELTQAQLAAQIGAARDLAGAADPARAAEIHRRLLHGTAVRAAEGANGWRAAMALWLGGAAALWGAGRNAATHKEAR